MAAPAQFSAPPPDGGQGPGPGGGFASPAPPQEDQGAAMALKMSLEIVKNARMLATKYPQVSSEAREINDAVSRMQGKIRGQGQQAEPQAPPV